MMRTYVRLVYVEDLGKPGFEVKVTVPPNIALRDAIAYAVSFDDVNLNNRSGKYFLCSAVVEQVEVSALAGSR